MEVALRGGVVKGLQRWRGSRQGILNSLTQIFNTLLEFPLNTCNLLWETIALTIIAVGRFLVIDSVRPSFFH